MDNFIDYYKLLEIDKNSSTFQINNAYRQMAKKHHPDINKSTDAAKIMRQLNEARDILTNPFKRDTYDKKYSSFYNNEVSNRTKDINAETFKQQTYKAKQGQFNKEYVIKNEDKKNKPQFKFNITVASILTFIVVVLGIYRCIQYLAVDDLGGFASNLFMCLFEGYCTFMLSAFSLFLLPILFKSLYRDLKYIITNKGEGLGKLSLYYKIFFIIFFILGAVEGYRTSYVKIGGAIFMGILTSFCSIPVTHIFYCFIVEPLLNYTDKYKKSKL